MAELAISQIFVQPQTINANDVIVDAAWTLFTIVPKPERLAGGLQSSLQNQGKKPWLGKLEKSMQIRIGYDDGFMVFTDDPSKYEPRSNVDTGPFERAWTRRSPFQDPRSDEAQGRERVVIDQVPNSRGMVQDIL